MLDWEDLSLLVGHNAHICLYIHDLARDCAHTTAETIFRAISVPFGILDCTYSTVGEHLLSVRRLAGVQQV